MKIIKIEPNENGGRPPIQDFAGSKIPAGYAAVACDTEVFYEFRGFVDAEFDGVSCVGMTGNQEALDAYLEEYPDVPPADPEPEMTTEAMAEAIRKGVDDVE